MPPAGHAGGVGRIAFIARTAGSWASASAAREAQVQAASRVQVTAALVKDAPAWNGCGARADTITEGRWRAPDGGVRTGNVFVTVREFARGTVRVWVDRAGRLASPPLTREPVAEPDALIIQDPTPPRPPAARRRPARRVRGADLDGQPELGAGRDQR